MVIGPPFNEFDPFRSRQTKSKPKDLTKEKVRKYLSTKSLPANLTCWEEFFSLFPTEEEEDSVLVARILKLEREEVYEYFKVFFGFIHEDRAGMRGEFSFSPFSTETLDFLKESIGKILELK